MLYIKFKEGDIKSLKIACREAERLGYVKAVSYSGIRVLRFRGNGLLILDDGLYYTYHYKVKNLLSNGYKHHKINPLRKLYYYLTT